MLASREAIACATCGSLYKPKFRRDRSRFCSIECRRQGLLQHETARCKECGATYDRRARNDREFCSDECLSEHSCGDPWAEEWSSKVRALVLNGADREIAERRVTAEMFGRL